MLTYCIAEIEAESFDAGWAGTDVGEGLLSHRRDARGFNVVTRGDDSHGRSLSMT